MLKLSYNHEKDWLKVIDFFLCTSDKDAPCSNCTEVKEAVTAGRVPLGTEWELEDVPQLLDECMGCIFYWLDEVEVIWEDGTIDSDTPQGGSTMPC